LQTAIYLEVLSYRTDKCNALDSLGVTLKDGGKRDINFLGGRTSDTVNGIISLELIKICKNSKESSKHPLKEEIS